MNRAALHKISYGLYIVTSGQDDKFNGQVANSMFQATSDPATCGHQHQQRKLHTWIDKIQP